MSWVRRRVSVRTRGRVWPVNAAIQASALSRDRGTLCRLYSTKTKFFLLNLSSHEDTGYVNSVNGASE